MELHRVDILAATESEAREISRMLDDRRIEITVHVAQNHATVELGEVTAEVLVVCLPKGPHPLKELMAHAAPAESRAMLYVIHPEQGDTRLWAFRQGASDVLTRPFTPAELMFRIERLIAQSPARTRLLDDPALLRFLQRAIDAEIADFEPALDPLKPLGHSYPACAALLEQPGVEAEFLEHLADQGFLARQVANRTRVCPVCASIHLNYREACPGCGGVHLAAQEMVHHFACAHIAPLEQFRRGPALECPKCQAVLRHIGLDYEKPVNHLQCADCATVFASARVEAQCLQCGQVSVPNQTLERLIYRYKITPLAHEAVREGRISGVNLESILRSSQTGLHSRQLFVYQLQRDLARHDRYKTPFTVLGVRLEDWSQILSSSAAQAHAYATSVYQALSHKLRMLDTTCVWDEGILAILLPSTNDDGGQVVARRMYENVRELEFLYSVAKPRISVSLVSHLAGHASSEEIMAAVLKDLRV